MNCESVTQRAMDTFVALKAAKMLRRECQPKFRKYSFRCGVLAVATADGTSFTVPVAEGVQGDYIKLATQGEAQEVLLDIVMGPDSVGGAINFGTYRYAGQAIPKLVGAAGSSIATVTEQGLFQGLEARQGGVNGLNLDCLHPFSQLNSFDIALKNLTGAAVAATALSMMLITARLDAGDWQDRDA